MHHPLNLVSIRIGIGFPRRDANAMQQFKQSNMGGMMDLRILKEGEFAIQ
jgi:hypothetical protein